LEGGTVLTGRQYGTIALVSVGLWVVATVSLHLLDPDLSVVNEYMSVYALGEYGWLLRTAAFLLGLATIAIGLGLRATLASGKRVTASWLPIVVAGLGFVVSGLFVTDPTGAYEAGRATISGVVHDLAGFVTLLSLLIAAWMLRGVSSRDDDYKRLARTQLWFAVLLTIATLILVGTSTYGPVGAMQRVLFVVLGTWLFVLAANIRHADKSLRGREPQPS
jgi:hypothetical protein